MVAIKSFKKRINLLDEVDINDSKDKADEQTREE